MDIYVLGKNGRNRSRLTWHSRPGEVIFSIPPVFGCGEVRKLTLDCGIDLIILDYCPTGNFVTAGQDHTPVIGFNFSLSGNTAMALNGIKQDICLSPGTTDAFYYPEKTGSCRDLANSPILRVCIQIPPRIFCRLMEDDLENLPAGIQVPAGQGNGRHFNQVDIITPFMQAILDQIIHCPYQGAVRRLFLEGKAMELAALKLDQLKLCCCPGKRPVLKSDDLDRIKQARSILADNFQNPPDLLDLSGQVGMSRTKLLKVFKKAYATTPAGYVRNLRLETAKQLLESGKMNVSEAAFFVGYSSLSHFACVFKKYHGTLPGRLPAHSC